ncbi:hypothetical protein JCM10213v2_000937 [Rhodosporidiobolus nylandii]
MQHEQEVPTFQFSHALSLEGDGGGESGGAEFEAATGGAGQHLGPLFLSIDAGVAKVRACVMSEQLEVVWVEEVKVDEELPEYGTRNGVYTLGDVVTSPSEMRIAALDVLLEKLSRDCPDPTLLSRLNASPAVRLSSMLTATSAFALATPATGGDSSTSSQVRSLESHFGALSLPTPSSPAAQLAAGRAALAQRTGAKPTTRGAAAQLMKVVQGDLKEREEGRLRQGVVERSGRITLESGLLAAIFLGRLAPLDASDACSSNLFNPVSQDWDDDVLDFVLSAGGADPDMQPGEGARRGRELLGDVEADGGAELGKISPYFVQRFGFSPDCIIAPFSGPDPSTFLSFPLYSSPAPLALAPSALGQQQPTEWRDALLSLSTSGGDTDVLMVPSASYIPDAERAVWCNPASGWWEAVGEGESGGGDEAEVESARFVAAVSSRDAGVGRALVRDLYANGEWGIFSHLSAIVPHGGTIGLDDKYFSFFFPHGEASVAQGFLRFVAGARVQEFPDRKANPRLLLESQFMSLRLRLSHIYRSLTPSLSTLDSPPTRPYDALGFPQLSPHVLPSRLILTGSPAQNPAMSSLLSTMFLCPSFLPLAGGLRSFATSAPGEHNTALEREEVDPRTKTTASALGAAYKAAWAYRRTKGDAGSLLSFQRFLREGIEALAAEKEAQGEPHPRQQRGDEELSHPSGAGTFSSTTSSAAQTYLSLPRSRLSSSLTSGTPSTVGGSSSSTYFTAASSSSSAPGGALGKIAEESPEGAATAELEPDPPGLTLVAMPDKDEWKYYSSMLPEFARLEKCALKGLI